MKAFIFLMVAVPLFSQSISRKTLYALEATACAASAADGISTALAIGAGAHETNPFLVKSGSGNLSVPKLIAFKSVMCAAPIAINWFIHKKHPDSHADYMGFAPSIGASLYYSWAAKHNFAVIADIKKEKTQ
jgi:hypothetical protein